MGAARSAGRRKAAAEATSPEDQAQIDAAHEALRVAERARKAREKMAALRERLRNPPSPDAPELIGAIMMQPELLEALEHKLREDSDGTFTATHMLTAEELGVLCVCLHFLRELGSVRSSGMGTSCPLAETRTAACRDRRAERRASPAAPPTAALVHRRGRCCPRQLRRPCTRDRGGEMGPRADARKLTRLPGALLATVAELRIRLGEQAKKLTEAAA